MADAEKKNIKSEKSRVLILLVFLIILVIGVVVALVGLKKRQEEQKLSGAMLKEAPGAIKAIPGVEASSNEYVRTQRAENLQKAEEAAAKASKGESAAALPTLTRANIRGGSGSAFLDNPSSTASSARRPGCSSDEVKRARAAGVTASELRCKGCNVKDLQNFFNAAELKDAGYTAAQLKAEGFSAEDLKNAGFSVKELMQAGVSATALKNLGFSAAEMRTAGLSAAEMQKLGYEASELAAAGFTAKEMLDAGFTAKSLREAGVTLKELRDAGLSAQALNDAGFTPEQLIAGGATDAELAAIGVLPEKIKELRQQLASKDKIPKDCSTGSLAKAKADGISPALYADLKCSVAALKGAGYTASQLREAGFSAQVLKTAGYTGAELAKGGYNIRKLLATGLVNPQELKEAGLSVKELKAAGLSAAEMKEAGFSAAEMKEAGLSAAELKAAGYTAGDLVKAGVSAEQLRNAGYTAENLKESGLDPLAIKAAGFTEGELIRAGVTAEDIAKSLAKANPADLRKAGYSPAQLKAAGMTADKLKAGGYSAKELLEAGYTIEELRKAGFSDADLLKAGVSKKDLVQALVTPQSGATAVQRTAQAAQLRASGRTAAELLAAGYTAEELKRAGFTDDELLKAGVSAQEIQQLASAVGGQNTASQKPLTVVNQAPSQNSNMTDAEKAFEKLQQRQNQQLAGEQRNEALQKIQEKMSGQATELFASWNPPPTQAYVPGIKDKDDGKAKNEPRATTPGSPPPSKNPARNIKAGTVVFAVLDTGINSDEVSPILATIVSGPLKGSKLLGQFVRTDQKVLISFNLMNIEQYPTSIPVNAVAIDQDTARTAVASSVDNHYLLRYGTLFASSFLSGFADAVGQSGATTTTNPLGGAVVTGPILSSKEKLTIALGNVGRQYSSEMGTNFAVAPTVKVDPGAGLGILFMADFVIPDQVPVD